MHNPPHPGALVADAVESLNISLRAFAKALNVTPSTIQRVIAEESSISPEMALRLSKVIGRPPEMWLKLQSLYALSKAEQTIDLSLDTSLQDTATDNSDQVT